MALINKQAFLQKEQIIVLDVTHFVCKDILLTYLIYIQTDGAVSVSTCPGRDVSHVSRVRVNPAQGLR